MATWLPMSAERQDEKGDKWAGVSDDDRTRIMAAAAKAGQDAYAAAINRGATRDQAFSASQSEIGLTINSLLNALKQQ